jgi:hypothetical protein
MVCRRDDTRRRPRREEEDDEEAEEEEEEDFFDFFDLRPRCLETYTRFFSRSAMAFESSALKWCGRPPLLQTREGVGLLSGRNREVNVSANMSVFVF